QQSIAEGARPHSGRPDHQAVRAERTQSLLITIVPAVMTYDRDEVACHHCFDHKPLKRWIREHATKRGLCPWCGKKGALVRLADLSEMFRDVSSLYEPIEGPNAFERGEFISSLLDDSWGVFSDLLHDHDNTAQDLAVAILYADTEPKERVDYPDYSGFFVD